MHGRKKIDSLAEACHPGTIDGAVPILTSGKRATSLPLYLTSNNNLRRHSRKMAYEEQDEATSFYIFYVMYMIITQNRFTMALLLLVISEVRHRR